MKKNHTTRDREHQNELEKQFFVLIIHFELTEW